MKSRPSKAKNLLVFQTDQQRWDSLGCYGNPVARTPNLDALAGRGTVFLEHYAANPVCMPSRASFMTGRYPQAHRVIDNGIPLPETEQTLAAVLAARGYDTCSVGKLHLTPYLAPAAAGCAESTERWRTGLMRGWDGPYYGFDRVQLTLGHGDACFVHGGHYRDWLQDRHADLDALVESAHRGRDGVAPGSSLPEELYSTNWVADRAVDFLQAQAREPFFLYVSFPDPHHPFTPPERYMRIFDGCAFPPPRRREGENENKPIHYRRAMSEYQHPSDGGAHRPLNMNGQDWRRVFAATYGMVALIDECVGRVLKCLRRMRLDERTVVAFTSDHGDMLGDHYLLYKGPYPCRSLLRVPFIVVDPEGAPGIRATEMMGNVDALPTFLDLLGMPIPDGVQGKSFAEIVRGREYTGETAALCCGWSKDAQLYYHQSLYVPGYRITYYPFQDDGELYDLDKDPDELENLYHVAAYQAVRNELLLRLYKEVSRAEPNKPPALAPW